MRYVWIAAFSLLLIATAAEGKSPRPKTERQPAHAPLTTADIDAILAQCRAFSAEDRKIGCFSAVTAARAKTDASKSMELINKGCGELSARCYESILDHLKDLIEHPMPHSPENEQRHRIRFVLELCANEGGLCFENTVHLVHELDDPLVLIHLACSLQDKSAGGRCFSAALKHILKNAWPQRLNTTEARYDPYRVGLLLMICDKSGDNLVSHAECLRGGIIDFHSQSPATRLGKICSFQEHEFAAPCLKGGLSYLRDQEKPPSAANLLLTACTSIPNGYARASCLQNGLFSLSLFPDSTARMLEAACHVDTSHLALEKKVAVSLGKGAASLGKGAEHAFYAHYLNRPLQSAERTYSTGLGPGINCEYVQIQGMAYSRNFSQWEIFHRSGEDLAPGGYESTLGCHTCLEFKDRVAKRVKTALTELREAQEKRSPDCFERAIRALTEPLGTGACDTEDVRMARLIHQLCADNDEGCAYRMAEKVRTPVIAEIMKNCGDKTKKHSCVESSLSVLITNPKLMGACAETANAVEEEKTLKTLKKGGKTRKSAPKPASDAEPGRGRSLR